MSGDVPKQRVLVIDDERLIADTLTKILRLHGYDSTALYSGEAALECIESVRPDVVLSDIRMRQVNGIETAMRIRELHPDCRVILFTATSISATERIGIEKLGFEFLQRPLHPQDVLRHLDSAQ